MGISKILLFGAGGTGLQALKQIKEQVIAFVDNDPKKNGTIIDSIPVISPEQIPAYDFDAIIVTSDFSVEIEQQLIALGYEDKLAFLKQTKTSIFRDGKGEVTELVYHKQREGAQAQLKTMHLNLTYLCNLKCRTCRPEGYKYSVRNMERGTLESIIADVFDSLTHLRLDSSGELTLSPELEYVLNEASRRKISVFISTNGTRITKEIADLFVSSTVEKIQVSLDSPDKTTNEWIRLGAKHDEIIEGTKQLVAAKKRAHASFPEIHFHGAILKQNVNQLCDMVDLAHKLEINGVTLAYGFIQSFMEPEWSVFFDRELCNQNVSAARERAQKLGLFFNAPTPFFEEQKLDSGERYCEYLFNWTYVDPSGKIFPCCTGTGEYVIGDASTEKLSDIWSNDRYQRLRNTHNSDSPEWDKCSRCYILSGWDPDNYEVHFHPTHWHKVASKVMEVEPSNIIIKSHG